MTRYAQLVCIVTVLAGNVLPAAAQTADRGTIAAGAAIGALFPDDTFENALAFDTFGELYVAPRVSVRGTLAWANPGVSGRTEDHFRQIKLLFNGVYYWDLDEWRPYASAGAGFYFVRLHLDGRPDPPGETRGGLNLGGGIEYLVLGQTAIRGDLRWDIVSHPPGLPDATGLTITIGVKRYF
jgi:hypothetical protein